jgi:hypothetical protein
MLQNDIRRADTVRHMSVDPGTRTADRADSHGHRPQNRLTCPNTQGRLSRAAVPGLESTTALAVRGEWVMPATAPHRVWPMRQQPGARPNAIPEITGRGFRRARAVETAGLAARRVSIVA